MVSGVDLAGLRPDQELRRLARGAMELGVGGPSKGHPARKSFDRRWKGKRAGAHGSPTTSGRRTHGSTSRTGTGSTTTTAPGSTIRRCRSPRSAPTSSGSRRARTSHGRSTRWWPSGSESRGIPRIPPGGRPPAFDESSRSPEWSSRSSRTTTSTSSTGALTIFWNKVREFGALLGTVRVPGRPGGRLLPASRRGARGARRAAGLSGAPAARSSRARPALLAADRRPKKGDLRGDVRVGTTARRWEAPGNDHRPDHDACSRGDRPSRSRGGSATPGTPTQRELSGFAASPGIVEGPARVILPSTSSVSWKPGEILVAPSTSPSWTPVFGKIAGAVLDAGGIMSHAAIIAREYGLPAAVGTGIGDQANQNWRSPPRRCQHQAPSRSSSEGPAVTCSFSLDECDTQLIEVVETRPETVWSCNPRPATAASRHPEGR